MGLIFKVLAGVVGLVVLIAAIGGILFVTDTPVEATIVEKDCDVSALNGNSNSQVTVKTKFPVPGIEYTLQDFSDSICAGLRAGENGNYAVYHIQSERTIFYEREGGACLYDSSGVVCGSS